VGGRVKDERAKGRRQGRAYQGRRQNPAQDNRRSSIAKGVRLGRESDSKAALGVVAEDPLSSGNLSSDDCLLLSVQDRGVGSGHVEETVGERHVVSDDVGKIPIQGHEEPVIRRRGEKSRRGWIRKFRGVLREFVEDGANCSLVGFHSLGAGYGGTGNVRPDGADDDTSQCGKRRVAEEGGQPGRHGSDATAGGVWAEALAAGALTADQVAANLRAPQGAAARTEYSPGVQDGPTKPERRDGPKSHKGVPSSREKIRFPPRLVAKTDPSLTA
jgi:hypothetical protein